MVLMHSIEPACDICFSRVIYLEGLGGPSSCTGLEFKSMSKSAQGVMLNKMRMLYTLKIIGDHHIL